MMNNTDKTLERILGMAETDPVLAYSTYETRVTLGSDLMEPATIDRLHKVQVALHVVTPYSAAEYARRDKTKLYMYSCKILSYLKGTETPDYKEGETLKAAREAYHAALIESVKNLEEHDPLEYGVLAGCAAMIINSEKDKRSHCPLTA